MILNNIFVNALIIFGVIVFFLVAVILNGLTKSPNGDKLPEKCKTCNCECIVKFDRNAKKESLIEYYKNCEGNNASQEKK